MGSCARWRYGSAAVLKIGGKAVLVDNLKINMESINKAMVINELLDVVFEWSRNADAVGRNRPFDLLEAEKRMVICWSRLMNQANWPA